MHKFCFQRFNSPKVSWKGEEYIWTRKSMKLLSTKGRSSTYCTLAEIALQCSWPCIPIASMEPVENLIMIHALVSAHNNFLLKEFKSTDVIVIIYLIHALCSSNEPPANTFEK